MELSITARFWITVFCPVGLYRDLDVAPYRGHGVVVFGCWYMVVERLTAGISP
jgi:hypothetical protein